MKKLFIIFPITFLIFFSCNKKINKNPPVATNGILDLRNWDLKKDGSVKLDGEWNFYWKKFVPPEQIEQESNPSTIKVPAIWISQKINNKKLTSYGYSTYHLKILLNPIDTPQAIKFPTIGCAYVAYLNGKKINQAGKIGKSYETMIPGYKPEIIDFFDSSSELNLVIHVSNFNQKYSGVWYSLHLGQTRTLIKKTNETIQMTHFLIGVFLIMFFYHIGLVILRPEEKLPLYFAIICLCLAIRNATMVELTIQSIFPEISVSWIKALEYLGFYIAVIAAAIFIYKLFPKESNKKIFTILTAPIALISIITIFGPLYFFSYLMIIPQAIFFLFFIYVTYVNILAVIRKRDGAIIFLFGLSTAFFCIINDLLYVHYIIDTAYLAPYGILILIICQSYVLSKKFSMAFFEVETLTSTLKSKNIELQDLNRTLEEKVEQRTVELKVTNENLEKTNTKLHKTTQQLVHSEKLSAIGELTAGITHELNNPLNVIKIINQSLIRKIDKNEIDIVEVKKEIHDVIGQVDRMAIIIDHMMNFSHASSHHHYEKINIGEIITNALMFMRQQLEDNNILLEVEIDESLPETSGYGIQIEQVIINLVNNAKNSVDKTDKENKFIKITARKNENNIEIEVSDNGVGIPKDIQEDIFEPFFTTNKRGEGLGLGMGIIKRIVSDHKGEIKLVSSPGEGASFIIKLPVTF